MEGKQAGNEERVCVPKVLEDAEPVFPRMNKELYQADTEGLHLNVTTVM